MTTTKNDGDHDTNEPKPTNETAGDPLPPICTLAGQRRATATRAWEIFGRMGQRNVPALPGDWGVAMELGHDQVLTEALALCMRAEMAPHKHRRAIEKIADEIGREHMVTTRTSTSKVSTLTDEDA